MPAAPPSAAGNTVVGRYAPSPTGELHLGNLRTALLAWLQARLAGGRFFIRMDDLDTPRNKAGATDQILRDLEWLGLDWDGEVIYQSARLEVYREAFDRLARGGLIFPCQCSRKDIDAALSAPHNDDDGHLGTRYPGTCRPENDPSISDAQLLAWRFLTADKEIAFEDRVLGLQRENLAERCGDFVVRRKDDIFAYQLACAVDDGLLGVTDVVRGADLLGSTNRQIVLMNALGYPIPQYWHVPLLEDAAGNKLSKRDGSDSLGELKESGMTPAEVVGLLAGSIGFSITDIETTAVELLASTTISDYSKILIMAQ